MLKKDLCLEIERLRSKLSKKSAEREDLIHPLMVKDNKLKNLEDIDKYNVEQLKKISQSIYTMLQVKYPAPHDDDATVDDCEEKRFLIFLHRLCIDKNYGSRLK